MVELRGRGKGSSGSVVAPVAETVRKRRVELDLTKAEAARRAGVSRRTWTEVESGARTTSSAVTLAQFDQALQLPEGTLWRLTAESALQVAQDLKRRAHAIVEAMSVEDIDYFVTRHGADTIAQRLDEMAEELRQLRESQQLIERELTREPGPSPAVAEADDKRPRADAR